MNDLKIFPIGLIVTYDIYRKRKFGKDIYVGRGRYMNPDHTKPIVETNLERAMEKYKRIYNNNCKRLNASEMFCCDNLADYGEIYEREYVWDREKRMFTFEELKNQLPMADFIAYCKQACIF